MDIKLKLSVIYDKFINLNLKNIEREARNQNVFVKPSDF